MRRCVAMRYLQIICARHEDQEKARPERHAGQDWNDPMHTGRCGRGEPGEADDAEHSADHDWWQSSFRRCKASRLPVQARIAPVVKDDEGDADEYSDHYPKESEPANACVPAMAFLEDDGEGREAEIQCPVHDGHVDLDVLSVKGRPALVDVCSTLTESRSTTGSRNRSAQGRTSAFLTILWKSGGCSRSIFVM